MESQSIFIFTWDDRQEHLQKMLEAKGYLVIKEKRYIPGAYSWILLPVPKTEEYLKTLYPQLKKGQGVVGWGIPQSFFDKGKQDGILFADYNTSSYVVEENAKLTAEGIILEAMKQGDAGIENRFSMITGFGRCGKVLAAKLQSMGSVVLVADRKEQKRKEAEKQGYLSCNLEQVKDWIGKSDFLFNTIPAPVIGVPILDQVGEKTILFDIASKPGGIDFDYCKKKKIKADIYPGLPGKYAPKRAAEILLKVIEETISGR